MCGLQVTGTGLCMELNRGGMGRAVNWYRFVFEINRAGVGRAIKLYRFVFGNK